MACGYSPLSAVESLAFVLHDVDGLLERYAKALEEHGMPLPFRNA